MAYAFLNQYYVDSGNSEIARVIERSITEYTIPSGVKKLGTYSLAYCSNLKKIIFNDEITTIDVAAFQYCDKINNLKFPDSVTHINRHAFSYAHSLSEAIFGKNVAFIGSSAFRSCKKCAIFDFTRSVAVPTLENIDAFEGISQSNTNILVPAVLYDEWTVATNWATYADCMVPAEVVPVIAIPDYISEGLLIENGVLNGRGTCTDSTIVVPEGVTRIAYGCFENDMMIDTLILPENGIEVEGQLGAGSTLRTLKNYYSMSASFGLSTAENLKLISVIGGQPINNYQFTGLSEGIEYDFSRCEKVIELSDTYNITVGEGTKIYVPLELYDEWIEATNWAEIAEYIVVAR